MQAIEFRPRQLACAHSIHRGLIAGAPCVSEFHGVDLQTLADGQFLNLLRHRRAPVDDGPERVEDELPYATEIGRHLCRLACSSECGDRTTNEAHSITDDEHASRDFIIHDYDAHVWRNFCAAPVLIGPPCPNTAASK